MAVYLVTYDLHNPGQNYKEVLEQIKKTDWVQLCESSYAISTSESAEAAYKRIHVKADDNDTFYVTAIHNPCVGRGPKATNDWMNARLTSCR